MLIQSGGGKTYAVLANSHEYELAVLPTISLASTTVFLQIRCRFKSLLTDVFNPMLVPKTILVGGIERSKNTLRGTVMLNTGFTVDKLGPAFPSLMADKLVEAAPGFILPHGEGPNGEKPTEVAALYAEHLHADFKQDFIKLAEPQLAVFYPPKDFTKAPPLITSFDLQIWTETNDTTPDSPFKVVATTEPDVPDNVQKVTFGGAFTGHHHNPDAEAAPAPSTPEPEAVDNSEGSADGKPAGGKVKIKGIKAPEQVE